MEINTEQQNKKKLHRWLTQIVVPRPIGWISSANHDGAFNLAPFSFFNVVSSSPPIVGFSIGARSLEPSYKDTLNNVRETGEFVVNVVTEELVQAMNITAREYPPEVDEFEQAGLTPVPSKLVKSPFVLESPIHLECRVSQIISLGEQDQGSHLVLGEVLLIRVDERILKEQERIDHDLYQPVGRLGGSLYARTRDHFTLKRA
jgi:flavin reductase (DIM6/NTAB) family NADH-FMN oxidoreductase RutF